MRYRARAATTPSTRLLEVSSKGTRPWQLVASSWRSSSVSKRAAHCGLLLDELRSRRHDPHGRGCRRGDGRARRSCKRAGAGGHPGGAWRLPAEEWNATVGTTTGSGGASIGAAGAPAALEPQEGSCNRTGARAGAERGGIAAAADGARWSSNSSTWSWRSASCPPGGAGRWRACAERPAAMPPASAPRACE